MKLKNILSTAILVLGFASCSNEIEEAIGGQGVPLQITANIDGTRAAGVNDREFFFGDTIGIYVDGLNDAWNVKADYSNRWNLHSKIILNETEHMIFAYYPFEEFGTIESYSGFTLTPGINYLVSTGTIVNSERPVANLQFRHVMARVQLVVNNPAKTALSSVVFRGKNIYKSALYNFPNTIDYWSVSQPVTINNPQPEEAETQTLDALLIPAAAGETEVTLYFADGKTYTTKVTLPELKQGGFYRLPITLDVESGNELDANGHEYVDLGLPSGTLWATCNIGASSPTEAGDYYAWGETETKTDYSWRKYKWCNGTEKTLTKYNSDPSYGTVDNKTELDLEDDVAYVKWGGKWRMPTAEEFQELCDECTWTYTLRNDIWGYIVSSKKNNNSIFLPGNGYWYLNPVHGVSELVEMTDGYYWSSSLLSTSPGRAFNLFFWDKEFYTGMPRNRNEGLSVRPVLCK